MNSVNRFNVNKYSVHIKPVRDVQMVQRSRVTKLKPNDKRLIASVDTANFWAFLAPADISQETYRDATRLWEHYLAYLTDTTVDYKPKGD